MLNASPSGKRRSVRLSIALAAALVLLLALGVSAFAQDSTVVVNPVAPGGWQFIIENPSSSEVVDVDTYVTGPLSPPAGAGSAEIELAGPVLGKSVRAALYSDTPLESITELKYSTLRSAGANGMPTLFLSIDMNGLGGLTGWQGRLVYSPDPDGYAPNTWYQHDALAGAGGPLTQGWFASDPDVAALTGCKLSPLNLCAWDEILTRLPGVTTQAPGLEQIGFKAGSGWGTWKGNVDELIVGIDGDSTTYDFEAVNECTTDCYVALPENGGSDSNSGFESAPFATIQKAVSVVHSGGTVHLGPTEFIFGDNYEGDVAIDKKVTIVGPPLQALDSLAPMAFLFDGAVTFNAGSEGSVVDGLGIIRDDGGDGIAVYADDVTVRNSLFLAVPGGSAVASQGVSGLRVLDSIFAGWNSCVYLGGGDGHEVAGNDFGLDPILGLDLEVDACVAGIGSNGHQNVAIHNNNFYGPFTDEAIGVSDDFGVVTGMSVISNNFTDVDGFPVMGLRTFAAGSYPTPSAMVNVVTAHHNWWGGPPSSPTNYEGGVDAVAYLTNGTDLQPTTVGFQPGAFVSVVEQSAIEQLPTGSYAFDIDVAIDVSTSSETIHGLQFFIANPAPSCLSFTAVDFAPFDGAITYSAFQVTGGVKIQVSDSSGLNDPPQAISAGSLTIPVVSSSSSECVTGLQEYIFEPVMQDCSQGGVLQFSCSSSGAVYQVDYNENPYPAWLSQIQWLENTPYSAPVGDADPDGDTSLTFAWCTVAGPDDSFFTLSSGVLSSVSNADYETKSSYTICLRAQDGRGGSSEVYRTITVLDENEPPHTFALTPLVIAENSDYAGTLSAIDPEGVSLTYALSTHASCTGTLDNGLFDPVSGSSLTADAFDFETSPNPVRVCVSVSDGPNTVHQVFEIAVTDVNEPPTDFALTPLSVAENSDYAGTLSSNDPELQPLTYALSSDASCTGTLDNGLFDAVSGTSLTADAFDYETVVHNPLRVCVSVSDGPNTVHQVFEISVTNVNELHTVTPASTDELKIEGSPWSQQLTVQDVDAGQTHSFAVEDCTLPDLPTGVSVSVTPGGLVQGTAFDYELLDASSFHVCIAVTSSSAPTPPQTVHHVLTVNTDNAIDVIWGNCNISGPNPLHPSSITAADVTATVLEYWDAPLDKFWLNAPFDSFRGSPEGCNSNRPESTVEFEDLITVADVQCTVRKIFELSCGDLPDAASVALANPALSIPQLNGATSVPVTLNANGNAVSALGFTLLLGSDVAFDATDANNDNLPDAIEFHIPAQLARWASYNAQKHAVQVVIVDMSLSGVTLDNAIATVTLSGNTSAPGAVLLTSANAGSPSGVDIPLDVLIGNVLQQTLQFFLPAIYIQ